jgi:signal transduction histidine kinase
LEELEQVWSPYYQIENAFTGEIPGMGLGLPTVASLVWQANGYCNIHNREQQVGITAEIRLPLLLEHNQGQPQDNNHSLTLKQLPAIRIL